MSSFLERLSQSIPPGLRYPAAAVAIGCAYYLGARFGLAVSFKPDYISVLWPPNAILLAALLLSPSRKWWYFLAASIPAELLADLPQGIALMRAIGFMAADWCEVLVASFLVKRFITEPLRFDSTRQLSLYLLFAAFTAPLISSVPGVAVSTFGLGEVNFWVAVRKWFISDSLTHFLLTPTLVLLFSAIPAADSQKSISRKYDEAFGFLLVVALSTAVYGSGVFLLGHLNALLFAPLPLLLWFALRFGPRGTFTASLAVTLISVWNASHGSGPFATGTAMENVLDLQLFLYFALSPIVFLSSLIEERKSTMQKLKESRKELSVANQRLTELDRLKTMFIASMSHELRTPLNAILGFSGVMLTDMTGELSEEQRRQVGMINDSGRHLLNLVNDTLDVSKIESGRMNPEMVKFDGVALLRDVTAIFDIAVKKKSLSLVLDTPEKLTIHSDMRLVRQVLMNIIGNAVKFTDRGQIEVRGETIDGQHVFSVRDSGAGIRSEDIADLFKPFSQIRYDGKISKEGAGLGLYLSRNLARLLGGDLDVTTELGVGSLFVFTLPAKDLA